MSMSTKKITESETIVINRSQITFAPYNPRRQDPRVVAELKKNFKRVGFLGGVVWNQTTGNIVSGHKRIQAMDLIYGYDGTPGKDYQVRVERVMMDNKTEREQNIFMNSPTVQGAFDSDLLAAMIPDIDYELAGLDQADITMLSVQTKNDFLPSSPITDIMEDMNAVEAPLAARREEIKEKKRRSLDTIEGRQQQESAYITLSFDSVENKVAFLEQIGCNPDLTIVKGEEVLDLLTV